MQGYESGGRRAPSPSHERVVGKGGAGHYRGARRVSLGDPSGVREGSNGNEARRGNVGGSWHRGDCQRVSVAGGKKGGSRKREPSGDRTHTSQPGAGTGSLRVPSLWVGHTATSAKDRQGQRGHSQGAAPATEVDGGKQSAAEPAWQQSVLPLNYGFGGARTRFGRS